jgi:membrane protease YdiL (CAAX protease family)
MSEPPAAEVRSAWAVLVAYVLAFVAIVAFSIVAADLVRVLFPDVPEQELWSGLPGLLAGGVASACALAVTLLIVSRPFDPARLRLRPGRERGADLAIAVIGTLALGQGLDSLTSIAGLSDRGSLAVIRRALVGAVGLELFAAVLVIGVLAGAAEEAFFRGYMQAALAARWDPWLAIGATSLAFGLMHLEWLHALLALALGLWLGIVTERMDSALPAVIAHVVNNTLFTLLTATTGTLAGFWPNAALGAAAVVVFAGAVLWFARRRAPASAP